MATLTPTKTALPSGHLRLDLEATACGTSDVIAIAVPGERLQVLALQLVAAGGTVTRIDPEWHVSATPSAATRTLTPSWGSETPGPVFGAVSETPDGSPVLAEVASGTATAYLRPKPDAGDGTIALRAIVVGR